MGNGRRSVLIRPITRDEVAQHIRMMRYAFGRYVGEEPKPEEVESAPIDGTIAVFDDGVMASCITIHDFVQSVRGVEKRMGGIGGVATLPEFRGRGYVRALMERGLAWMREHGMATTMLRPFSERFYERFGYVRTNGSIDYTLSCGSFTQFRGCLAGYHVRRFAANEAHERFLAARRAIGAAHGRVLREPLDEAGWKRRFNDRLFVFVTRDGRDVAIASYTKEGFLAEGRLALSDIAWADEDAREALFGFLALHRDQISRVTLRLPHDANIHALLPAIEGPVETSYHGAPWMVRIVDVERALHGVPAAAAVDLAVAVEDQHCAWNDGCYRVATADGQSAAGGRTLVVTPSESRPDLTLPASALAALLYGSLPATQIERELGPFSGAAGAFASLAAALPPRTLFNDYWF